jgi:sulfur carrier protein ThiS
VIVVPPLDTGAVQATVTDVGLATVAVPIVGAPDTVTTGVTALDAVDKLDVPAEFVAVVLKKYVVPFVKPVTTHEPDAPVTVQPVVYVPVELVD